MHEIDLDAYFARIGHGGSTAPRLDTLRQVNLLHATAIPFENLDPLMRRPVRLDLHTLQQKLVHAGRGGYCFEQNTLLEAVLRQLGFAVRPLAARVLLNAPEGLVRPRAHMLLQVELAEGRYIADVGFGLLSLTAPLRFEPGTEQETPHGPYRLVPVGREFQLQTKRPDRWTPIYQISLQEQAAPDWEVANWFTSTHPSSVFINSLMAARPDGALRYGLLNHNLSIHHPDGTIERRSLETPAEIASVLQQQFRVWLPDGWEDVFERLPRA